MSIEMRQPPLRDLLHKVAANPRVYDLIQQAFGFERVARELGTQLTQMRQSSVLEVGAGTGLWRALIPTTARYVWLDIDPEKLAGFRKRATKNLGMILGDASSLCFSDRSFDFGLCAAVSHHLSDEQLEQTLAELARVVRQRLVFLDPVSRPNAPISALLWKYDRGASPRTAEQLRLALSRHFTIEDDREFQIYHRYLICSASPRSRVS